MSFDGCSEENLICKKTQGSSVRHSTRPVEHSKGRNPGKNKTFLTFGQWARMFWVSGTTKLAELPKLHSMWLEQLLDWIELFFKKIALLILLPTFSEKFQYSLKTDPPALSSSHTSRLQKLQKKNWTNQAGILRVRRSLTFRGKKSGSHQNFSTYGQWAKKWCFVGEIFLAELLTPHSICSAEKNFGTKCFFPKKNMFDILFWFWMKKIRICGRRFQQGCQKQNPRDQRNFLVKLYLEEDTTLCLLMVFLRKIWFAKKLNVRQ